MFVHSCRKAVGAFAAVLGGPDTLGCRTLVVPTDEDLVIARHVSALLAAPP